MKCNKKLSKTYLIYFIVLTCFVGLRIASSLGAFSFIKDSVILNMVTTIITQVVVMGVVPITLTILLFKKGFKQTFKDIGFKKINFKSICLCILLGVLVYILNVIVATVFSFILSIFGYSASSSGGQSTTRFSPVVQFIFSTILVAILPAIFEEIVHRGILLRKSANEIGYKKAIIISSVLFGLMHLNVTQCFYAIFIGIIIGFVSSSTGSIYPAMILHFMNNFVNVYFSYADSYALPGGNLATSVGEMFSSNFLISVIIFVVFTLCVCALAIYIYWKLLKETRFKEINNSLMNVVSEVNETSTENLEEKQVMDTFKDFVAPFINNEEDLIDSLLPPINKDKDASNLRSNVFKICSLFLGIIVTLFTMIWGIL